MPQLTAQCKHDILIHCQSRRTGESEVDVAAAHGVTIDRNTITRWRNRWNGTPQSLERKPVSGRPRILTRVEVSRHLRAPILTANRSHTAISYTKIYESVKQKTRKKLSLRTLQRTGKEQLDIECKATVKRTQEEGQCSATVHECSTCMMM
jgi:transposase